jgi:hypothetical protein
VTGVTQSERFFRLTASLDVDKQDLKRYSNFINHTIDDLLVRGQAAAGANDRDIIEPHDLPITPGLQEDIYAFSKLDELIDLHPVPERIAGRPPFGRTLSDTAESCLPRIAGGLSVALARSFNVIDRLRKIRRHGSGSARFNCPVCCCNGTSATMNASFRHVVCPLCAAVNRVPVAQSALRAKCGTCHQPLFTGRPVAADGNAFER